MSRSFIITSSILLLIIGVFVADKPILSGRIENLLAAAFFTPSITVESLREKFDTAEVIEKVRVLLIPGHESDFGGSEYGSLKERDLVVDLSEQIAELLEEDGAFEVFLTRDKENWNPELENYFQAEWQEIIDFTRAKKVEMQDLIEEGELQRVSSTVKHNRAPDNVALRLYGINKWSSENNIDLLIHVHLNDHPRPRQNAPGWYRGFAIYVPEKQYSNAIPSLDIAESVREKLEESFAVSNFPAESMGIVESPHLIAVGSANTLDAASILVEYGYIYRPSFTDPNLREETFAEMAQLTYEGLRNFFQK